MTTPPILITGASGFIGRALLARLQEDRQHVIPVLRKNNGSPDAIVVEDINAQTKWAEIVRGGDCVVHLAARVHIQHDSSKNPLQEYRATNVDATLQLAQQSAQAGVRRFIFLSSIKVNGESTSEAPFSAKDVTHAHDLYGISKKEAEEGLLNISQRYGMEVVIIRPPLVYGPGVKANFLQLMRLIRTGLPLPLACVNNQRSMIFVGNLVDLIVCCIKNENAAGNIFLASDGHDVSTPELVRYIAAALDQSDRLFPMPSCMLRIMARCCGKAAIAERLLGSLQVDINDTRNILQWTPPYSVEYGVTQTVQSFLAAGNVA